MKKLHVSGFGYDQGKSGISKYINEFLRESTKTKSVVLYIKESDLEYYPKSVLDLVEKVVTFKLPSLAIFEVLFHTIFLPFLFMYIRNREDYIFLPAVNRRIFIYHPSRTIGVFHDLSQYYIKGKYDIFRHFYVLKLIPLFLKTLSQIVTVSENTKSDLVNILGIEEERVIASPNGFDISEKVAPVPVVGVPLGGITLTYVSRLEWPGKNHKVILEAMSLLRQRGISDVNVVFVGKDWGGEAPIRKLMSELSLNDQVLILGHLHQQELEYVYQESDIFIHPSLYEGFGFPLLEAMARGVLCLSSNTGSLPEVGGEAALYFNPRNSEELANLIETAVETPDAFEVYRDRGLSRVLDFTWQRHINLIFNK